jgi:hypothetical protein
MAITIYNEPAKSDTPYRPYFFDCSSDDANIVRIIADVYVDSSLITTVDVDPTLGTTDQFKIEIGKALHKQLIPAIPAYDPLALLPEIFNETSGCKDQFIRAFEVLDNTATGTLDTSWSEDGAGTDFTQSSTIDVLDAIYQHEQKDNISDYNLNGTTKKWGTNRPNLTKVSRGQLLFFGGGINAGNSYRSRVVEYTGLNGTGTATNNDSSVVISSCTKINAAYLTSLMDAGTKSIGLQLFQVGIGIVSEELILNVYEPCPEDVILHWYNQYGQWDSYVFTGNVRQKTRTKTKMIDRRLAKDYSFSDRGMTDITKDNQREFEVFSGTERPETIEWLAEIGESIEVYVEETINETTELIPINVKKVSSAIEDEERVRTQLSVTYWKSNQRITHEG